MPFQPGAMLYTQGFGSRPEDVEVPHLDSRAPTTTDTLYPVGKRWIFVGDSEYVLMSFSSSGGILSANWVIVTSATGNIVSVTGTANQITASTTAGAVTLSTPATFIAPGSIASTTTNNAGTSMTAGTTITATLGNITATNGNFVASTAGTGLLFNANTASGAAPGPVVLNSRAGQVVFTGVSIAAAADLTLTITNSAITGATTQVIYSMSGSTTGSAPSIKSVTNSAGSSVIVVTNGTGATTTTANITFNFIVVN